MKTKNNINKKVYYIKFNILGLISLNIKVIIKPFLDSQFHFTGFL